VDVTGGSAGQGDPVTKGKCDSHALISPASLLH
jgi:hypothetical protein